ncbi:hypothetical protein FRC10_004618 [Ceratobasidium sp. 414]|nr:hypothetical protein FRC10_005852 [Ceratobasidium sp. 414]KAG8728725.1 hypothetical protein FRC10_004618 [Ceratobasidium sp. 414]
MRPVPADPRAKSTIKGTRPASGPANALLQAANLAYAELMKQEDEEKRKREASETLVGLQWRYA